MAENLFFCRYSNEEDKVGKVYSAENEENAVKQFIREYPSNEKRKYPVFVRWYAKGIKQTAMFTATLRGIRRV